MKRVAQLPCSRRALQWLLLAALLPAAGCLQIDTTIRLNEDGSGTITERLRFSRKLLDADKKGGAITFASYLTEVYARKRATTMGKGVTLVSHTVRDAEAASRESVTVYSIPNLTDFRYTSPFISRHIPAQDITIAMYPQLSDHWTGWRGGDFIVDFRPATPPARPALTNAPPLSPIDIPGGPLGRQAYRDLAPAFRDMLEGFRVRVSFEAYGRIHRWQRGRGVGRRGYSSPNKVDLVNYSYKGDSGTEALDNEEVMADLLQMHFNPDSEQKTYSPFLSPKFITGVRVALRPSLPLFDRYFKGKTIVTGPDRAKKKYKATFERFGYKTADERRKGRKEE